MRLRVNDANAIRISDQGSNARVNVAAIDCRRPGHNIAAAMLPDVPHSDDTAYDDGTLYAHG